METKMYRVVIKLHTHTHTHTDRAINTINTRKKSLENNVKIDTYNLVKGGEFL